jgi:hypothetical protein
MTLLPQSGSDLDSLISELINENNIKEARKKSDKRMSELTTDQYKYLRKRAKIDSVLLITGNLRIR